MTNANVTVLQCYSVTVYTVIENSANTVLPVPAIMIKARNMITAYSIFPNWPEAGRGEDEGEM